MVNRRVHMIWSGDNQNVEGEVFSPPADVYELDNNVMVEIELPGVSKENLEVCVIGNRLTVSGRKQDLPLSRDSEGKQISFLQIERKFGRFLCEFELPSALNTNQARAKFKEGILLISFPRIQDKRGAKKRIPVE